MTSSYQDSYQRIHDAILMISMKQYYLCARRHSQSFLGISVKSRDQKRWLSGHFLTILSVTHAHQFLIKLPRGESEVKTPLLLACLYYPSTLRIQELLEAFLNGNAAVNIELEKAIIICVRMRYRNILPWYHRLASRDFPTFPRTDFSIPPYHA